MNIDDFRRKSAKIKSSEIVPNHPQWLPMPKKPPETPEKRPKTSENMIFRMIFSDPEIVLGWLFGLVEVVSRIIGEFRRHMFFVIF